MADGLAALLLAAMEQHAVARDGVIDPREVLDAAAQLVARVMDAQSQPGSKRAAATYFGVCLNARAPGLRASLGAGVAGERVTH